MNREKVGYKNSINESSKKTFMYNKHKYIAGTCYKDKICVK